MKPARIVVGLLVAAALALTVLPMSGHACPFCSAPSQTLGEQVAQADAVVLAQWVEGTRPENETAGSSTYEIVQVAKQPPAVPPNARPAGAGNASASAATGSSSETGAKPLEVSIGTETVTAGVGDIPDLAPKAAAASTAAASEPIDLHQGDRIVLARFRAGKKGDLFLLMGTRNGSTIEWGSPLEVTETSYNYVVQAPSREKPARERLSYYMKFLEFPDRTVADDAFAEFANAPYKDITPLADVMPREKIREWITSPNTQPNRLGLYGLFLGLCGDKDDVRLMEEKIGQETEEFRLGMDGVMSGYLLLTGTDGLPLIEDSKLKNTKTPFSETYAAMQALRFMWTYAEGRIDKNRLRESMRLLLDRPELADLVIADLARWEDWTIQDQLMELYGEPDYNIPSIKRAIVRYMLVSSKERKSPAAKSAAGAADAKSASPAPGGPPEAVRKKGKEYLDKLREQDPKTVADAERFFFIN